MVNVQAPANSEHPQSYTHQPPIRKIWQLQISGMRSVLELHTHPKPSHLKWHDPRNLTAECQPPRSATHGSCRHQAWFLLTEGFVCNFENSIILKIYHCFRKTAKKQNKKKMPFYSDKMFNERSKHIKPYPPRLITDNFQHRKVNYHVHFRFLCTHSKLW